MDVERYREHYKKMFLPAGYGGWRHALTALAIGSSALGALIAAAPDAFRPGQLRLVPFFVLIANFVEYWAHRGPMHRRIGILSAVFDRHTRRHHRYFTASTMPLESPSDLHAVLFPTPLLLFFGAAAALLGTLVGIALSPETGILFAATSIGYYLAYEALHLSYHLPEAWLARSPRILRFLARHHRIHHAPERMRERNFNLVFPLFDWVFGTLERTTRAAGIKSQAKPRQPGPADAGCRRRS